MGPVWDAVPPVDVLVTHGPPNKILDEAAEGEYAGDLMLRHAIFDRIKPRVHIFGHMHENYGQALIRGTHFYNAAFVNDNYVPANQPWVIELL